MKPGTTKTLLASLMLAAVSVVVLTTMSRASAALTPALVPSPWPPELADYVSVVGTGTFTAAGIVVFSVPNDGSFILMDVGVNNGEVFQRLGGTDTIKVHSPPVLSGREGPLGIVFEPGSDVVIKKPPGFPDVTRDFVLLGYLAR